MSLPRAVCPFCGRSISLQYKPPRFRWHRDPGLADSTAFCGSGDLTPEAAQALFDRLAAEMDVPPHPAN